MIAVVLFHVLLWDHAVITAGQSPLSHFWSLTDTAVERLRMPVLFALSGLLAAGGLSRGWRDGSARRRVAANYYVYAVWLLIYFAVFTALDQEDFPHSIDSPGAWLAQFGVPDTTLWFIFALAVYPPVLMGLRASGLSAGSVLAVALLLWVVGNWSDLPGFTGKILENFLFFAVGVHATTHLWRLAEAGWRWAAAFGGLFLALVALATVVPDGYVVPVVLLSSLVGIPACVGAVGLCCRAPALARCGRAVGSRTLPVYLLHPLLLAAWSSARPDWALSATSTPVGDALYPPALTAALVLVSILLHGLLRRVPGNVLFTLPPALTTSRTTGRTAVAAVAVPGRPVATTPHPVLRG